MKTHLTLAATFAACATGAFAGGIDRSGQSVAVIFEEGNHFEANLSYAIPKVSGAAGPAESGDMAGDYMQFGFAYKTDLNDKVSLAVIADEPFGADVSYPTGTPYPLAGTSAEVDSFAITVLGNYQATDRISVHGGIRLVTASGFYNAPVVPYASTYSSASDVGYVIGAAYEIPDIALRAALTYSSATEFSMDGTVGNLTAKMPQSVNFEFQTGIAADTLLMASVRWADWSEATIDDDLAGNLTDFGNKDTYTYTLGVGRRFSDKFSGSFTIGYEKAAGDLTGNLAPTDGYWSASIGGEYDLGNGAKISGGIQYRAIGDATTQAPGAPAGTPFGTFTNNNAVAFGVKFSQTF
ncbi:OmpP1/FadL family transporter [Celeribacter sp.]|uniref:OmpP1/FadL family transporter n=1 Tax=Celeribacter sp. TaxID=1890673 RepID=UPI003A8D5D80